MKLFKESGAKLDALVNQQRSDQGNSRVIDQETGLALIRLRKELPKATVQGIIETMQNRKLISPGMSPAPTTVWRFLNQHGMIKPDATVPEDRRKFEAKLPNDWWQSDCMQGPSVLHDGKMQKTYLLAFIDDHSRLIPHAEFYLSESLDCYIKAFEQAIATRGLPRKLYTDNGPAFRFLFHILVSRCLYRCEHTLRSLVPPSRALLSLFLVPPPAHRLVLVTLLRSIHLRRTCQADVPVTDSGD